MRALTRALLALALILAPLSHAQAGMRRDAVELGIFTGSYNLEENDSGDHTLANVQGFRLGWLFTREHEIEFVYDTAESRFAGDHLEEFDSWSFRYLYNFSPGSHNALVPYVGAGLGNVDDEVFDVPLLGDVSDDGTQYSLFGGVRGFGGRVFALRGEVDIKAFSTFGVDQTVIEATVGLSWVIGGHH